MGPGRSGIPHPERIMNATIRTINIVDSFIANSLHSLERLLFKDILDSSAFYQSGY